MDFALESGMKRLSLEIDGKIVEGWAEKIGTTVWAHVGGRTIRYEPPRKESRRGSRGAVSKAAGDIAAPMPGKINKISVSPGDVVQAHQVLVVMEAMKMEYTLKAAADGIVASIHCAQGDQVALGQLLVKIELSATGNDGAKS
jgi:3-methylcrotonyl-CoA carboxylase alpha subunit